MKIEYAYFQQFDINLKINSRSSILNFGEVKNSIFTHYKPNSFIII